MKTIKIIAIEDQIRRLFRSLPVYSAVGLLVRLENDLNLRDDYPDIDTTKAKQERGGRCCGHKKTQT